MARLVYASQRYVENPMLSLIVPVYNTPVSLLTRALQPFIDQQYSDMEVILVDDASQSLEHSEVHALLEPLSRCSGTVATGGRTRPDRQA